MNNLPDEILLHLFTYINMYSMELKPLMEINKRIRQILYLNKYTKKDYPCLENESVASVCHSFLSFIKYLETQKREAEEFSRNNSFILDLYEIEDEDEVEDEINEEFGDVYLHFPPF